MAQVPLGAVLSVQKTQEIGLDASSASSAGTTGYSWVLPHCAWAYRLQGASCWHGLVPLQLPPSSNCPDRKGGPAPLASPPGTGMSSAVDGPIQPQAVSCKKCPSPGDKMLVHLGFLWWGCLPPLGASRMWIPGAFCAKS